MSGADKPGSKDLTRVRRFLEVLAGTQILAAEAMAEIEQAWNQRGDDDSQLLAKDLVQREKLTRYQAAAIYQGKTRGLVLNDYVVLDKLGSGGMGNVYKAQHRTSGTIVAIKMMSSASMRSADIVKRFQREAEMVERLNHPNIVRAIEAGSVDGSNYFVMEFVTGIDLSNYLKQQGAIPYEQAMQFVIQAAQGLDYAHAQGVVHRDIKPSNLFLCKNGTVKVLDLGLARLSDPADAAAAQAREALTQTGQVMGTVDYMAPEQALNTRHADARADIYSLGCTLYRLITGSIPFKGDSVVEKILAHREQPIPSVRTKFPEIPLGVDFALSRMLAKRPTDRYQTMREVVQALQSAPQWTSAPSELPLPSGPMPPSAPPPPASAMPSAATTSPSIDSSNSLSLGVSVSPAMREPSSHSSVESSGHPSPIIWGAIASTVVAIICAISYGLWQPPGELIVDKKVERTNVDATSESSQVVEHPIEKQVPEKNEPVESKLAIEPSTKQASGTEGGEKVLGSGIDVGASGKMASESLLPPDMSQTKGENASAIIKPATDSPRTSTKPVKSTPITFTLIPENNPLIGDNTRISTALNPGPRLHPDVETSLAEQLIQLNAKVRLLGPDGMSYLLQKGALIRGQPVGIVQIKFTADSFPPSEEQWTDILSLSRLAELEISYQDWFSNQHLQQICRDLPSVAILNLDGTSIGDDDLVELAKLPRLRSLQLNGTKVTEAGLSHLTRCKSLRSLGLNELPITNEGVAKLKPLSELVTLRLNSTQVDNDLIAIQFSRPIFAELSLINTNVDADTRRSLLLEYPTLSFQDSDTGLRHFRTPFETLAPELIRLRPDPLTPDQFAAERQLAEKILEMNGALHIGVYGASKSDFDGTSLPVNSFEVRHVNFNGRTPTPEIIDLLTASQRLTYIDLSHTDIDDAFVERIAEIKTLAALNLNGTKITDKAFVDLCGLPKLEAISAAADTITDETLVQLAKLKTLRWLDVSETPTSFAGLKQFLTASKSIETIVLRGTELSDADCRVIPRVWQLAFMDLRDTSVTSIGLEALRRTWGDRPIQLLVDEPPAGKASDRSQPRPANVAANSLATMRINRKAAPNADELAKALHSIRERNGVKADQMQNLDAQRAMLDRIMKDVRDVPSDLTTRFALLCEARDVAIQLGDRTTLTEILSLLSASFLSHPVDWLCDAVESAADKDISPHASKQVTYVVMDLFENERRNKNYAAAQRLINAASRFVIKTRDDVVVGAVEKLKPVTAHNVDTYNRAVAARRAIGVVPDDPESNLTLGRYCCFVERNWMKAFGYFVKLSDADIQAAALASLENPQDPNEQVQIGEMWWNKAAKPNAILTKEELKFIAMYWYNQAAPKTGGLIRSKVEKRLLEGQLIAFELARLSPHDHAQFLFDYDVIRDSKAVLAHRAAATAIIQRGGDVTLWTSRDDFETFNAKAPLPKLMTPIASINCDGKASSLSDQDCALLNSVPSLYSVLLEGPNNVTDKGLRFLRHQPGLDSMTLYKMPGVTGNVLTYVANHPRLRSLELGDMAINDLNLEVIASLPKLDSLTLNRITPSSNGMGSLTNAPRLRSISIGKAPWIDASFWSALATWPRLEHISIFDSAVPPLDGALPRAKTLTLTRCIFSNVSPRALAGWPKLESLTLKQISATDEELVAFDGLNSLKVLHIQECAQFEGAFLKYLGRLKGLNELKIERTHLTLDSMQSLPQFPNLTRLEIDLKASLPSGHLESLSRLTNLNHLRLWGPFFDDSAVPFLARCSSAKTIRLDRTKITPEGVANLQGALPECKIALRP